MKKLNPTYTYRKDKLWRLFFLYTRKWLKIWLFAILIGSMIGLTYHTIKFIFSPKVAESKTLPVLTEVQAEVSAYTSSPEETDERYWEMANGETVHEYAIACPERYEFGTEVLIENEWYICKDRMNKRYRDGNYFDLYKSSKTEALAFGRQELAVYILNK